MSPPIPLRDLRAACPGVSVAWVTPRATASGRGRFVFLSQVHIHPAVAVECWPGITLADVLWYVEDLVYEVA